MSLDFGFREPMDIFAIIFAFGSVKSFPKHGSSGLSLKPYIRCNNKLLFTPFLWTDFEDLIGKLLENGEIQVSSNTDNGIMAGNRYN